MVQPGWDVVAPILDAWARTPDGVEPYPAGAWGPPSADALLADDGKEWRTP
jgi:glucose-6-phosphate 1-dehydrogenase